MEKIESGSGADRPAEIQFVAIRTLVKRGQETVAHAISQTMARRIARALNLHKPNAKGY